MCGVCKYLSKYVAFAGGCGGGERRQCLGVAILPSLPDRTWVTRLSADSTSRCARLLAWAVILICSGGLGHVRISEQQQLENPGLSLEDGVRSCTKARLIVKTRPCVSYSA